MGTGVALETAGCGRGAEGGQGGVAAGGRGAPAPAGNAQGRGPGVARATLGMRPV